MRNFRRLAASLVALVFVLSFSSCEKQQAKSSTIDVSFDIADLTNGDKKGALESGDPGSENTKDYPDCTDLETDFVIVVIDGSPYTLDMTSLAGSITEVVQLDADAPNVVTSLMAFSNDQSEALYVAPGASSFEVTDGGLIGVPYTINTAAWNKEAVHIDVVCWHPYTYKSYSWNWFDIDYHQVKTLCFFGDVCTKFYPTFGAAGYDLQADFTVTLTYTNSAGIRIPNTVTTKNNDGNWVNEDGPLCISYIDDLMQPENATYDLTLHTPTGDILLADDVVVAEGTWSEDGKSDGFGGMDGIYLFNVGNCGIDEEGQFPSYLPLPKTVSFTLKSANGDFTGRYQATATATGTSLQGLMPAATFNTWCIDPATLISYNTPYAANVYSLLDLATIPNSTRLDKIVAAVGKLHWIINHTEEIKAAKPSWTKVDFQKLIWHVVDATYHSGYSGYASTIPNYNPKVGDDALVIIDPASTSGSPVQAFGVRIDP